MTKDDILRMGREAGMHDPMIFIGAYERFANLVADAVAAAEREACAKLVDFILKEGGGTWGDAIRARGNT